MNNCFAFEYYHDAFVGPDAPFPDMKPSADDLCEYIQDMARDFAPLIAYTLHLENEIKRLKAASVT
jgi:hypothetical protein